MSETETIHREQALEQLRRHGIDGAEVYLIDIIPLIEMTWADGMVQIDEILVLDEYLRRHLDHLNRLAGYEIITPDAAYAFLRRFLEYRPDPALLRTLRELIPSVRLTTSDPETNKALRESMLSACLDIAASTSVSYPFAVAADRIDPEEKRCFFEILDSLEARPTPAET